MRRVAGAMDYHLKQDGKTTGVFPLEELCRRRKAGELTGTEWVWCDGMAEWQRLDTVLQREMPGTVLLPPPIPKPEPRRIFTVMTVSVVLAVLAVFSVFGILGYKFVHGIQRGLKQATPHRGPALAAASKPVQWTTNTLTAAKVLEGDRKFALRQFLEGYEKCSERNPSCDAEALEVITNWIDFHLGSDVHTNNSAIELMCNKLAANPACDDPLVLSVVAANTDELHEGARRFDRAVKGFEHSRYKAYPKLYATVMLARNLIQLNPHSDRVRALDESAIQLLNAALKDDSI